MKRGILRIRVFVFSGETRFSSFLFEMKFKAGTADKAHPPHFNWAQAET